MRKAVFTFLLALLLFPAGIARAEITNEDIDVSWLAGMMTENTLYINSEAQMYGLWAMMSDDPAEYENISVGLPEGLVDAGTQNFLGKRILLMADLDLKKWETAGKLAWTIDRVMVDISGSTPFLGEFDGQGRTIKYSIAREDTDTTPSALFAYLGKDDNGNTGKVRNLTLDISITAGNYVAAAGGVTALNQGVISDIAVSADMRCNGRAGGIAAMNANTVERCAVSGDFYIEARQAGKAEESFRAGGIVGLNAHSESYAGGGVTDDFVRSVVVRDSRFAGNMYVSVLSTESVPQVIMGGIAGNNLDAAIENCAASGSYLTVENKHAYASIFVGGVAGGNQGFISDCSFEGKLSGLRVGGIAGGRGSTEGNCTALLENCRASFDFVSDFFANSVNSSDGVYVGGLLGMRNVIINIKNCYFEGKLAVDVGNKIAGTSLFVGGFLGGNATNLVGIYNSVASADISTNASSGTNVYLGGLAGYVYTAAAIKNCVFIGNVTPLTADLNPNVTNRYYGAVTGFVRSNSANYVANFNDIQWFSGDSNAKAASGAVSMPQSVVRKNAISELPPTAALLSPVHGAVRVGDAPLGLEVKIYPEGSAGAAGISGQWSQSGGTGTVELNGDGLTAAVTGVSAGPRRVAFTVSETAKLYGDAAPTLCASVNVIRAYASNAGIKRIYAKIDGTEYAADGDGLIVVPDGASLTSLPVWAETEDGGASVSIKAPNGDEFAEFTAGEALDFSGAKVWILRVTAEDGVTSEEYPVYAEVKSAARKPGTFVTDDPEEWTSFVVHKPDGTVEIAIRIPIDDAQINADYGFSAPYAVDVETTGIKEESVTLKIVRDDGMVVHDYRTGPVTGGGGDPFEDPHLYTLLFSGVCDSDADYEDAGITSVTWWQDEISVPFEQSFVQHGSGGGVSISGETEVADEIFEKKPSEEVPGGDTGGGCDAGAAAALVLAGALAAKAAASAARRKK